MVLFLQNRLVEENMGLGFYNNTQIENHINDNGQIMHNNVEQSIHTALEVGKKLLGGTLVTNNQIFIIAMVELYYGSIADEYHDWYRVHHTGQHRGISTNQVEQQSNAGLGFYSKQRINSKRNRIDIVIGKEGVAVSYLLRNLIRMDGTLLSDCISGRPGNVANTLFSQRIIDHPEIAIRTLEDSKIFIDHHSFIDTHDAFMQCNPGLEIESNLRCINNAFKGLKGTYQNRKWNLSFYIDKFCIPEMITDINNRLSHCEQHAI